jgi:hypothetical protein
LRSISSRISSSVAVEDRSASLASACTAPRTAKSALVLVVLASRRASFQSRGDLAVAEARAPRPPAAPSSSGPKRDRRSATTSLPTASNIRRTWRLRPSRRTISISRSPTRVTSAGGWAVLELGPAAQPLQSRSPAGAAARPVGLGDFVARMGEPVRQLAVVVSSSSPVESLEPPTG